MTEPKRLRIFISSPGDVGEERVIAGRVIARLAGEFGQFLTLEPILWEHEPLRATAHFADEIVLPSKTDIVVCILWSRLGTRLPEGFKRDDGTPYASGTEFEFEDAARSYRQRGTPDLLVYRKTREAVAGLGDEPALLRRLEQKKALDAFIDRWFGSAEDSFKAAFHAFFQWLQSPLSIALHLAALPLVVYHSITWFNLTPKVMVLWRGEERVSPILIAGSNYAAWIVVSYLVAWFFFDAK